MKLGILVSTDRNLRHVLGIARAALGKGHEVEMFVMDEGVRLMTNSGLGTLAGTEGFSASYCEYSLDQMGISREQVPDGFSGGSQFDNALMARNSDRVVSL
jgi:predicted peroxiredoxin